MQWSLSEFLNWMELRSQTWCFVELQPASGFCVPQNEEIYFYASLEGRTDIADSANNEFELRAGSIMMMLSGDAHTVSNGRKSVTTSLEFLTSGAHADAPPTFKIGSGFAATRLLAGRLTVRWPGGWRPPSMPAALNVPSTRNVLNFHRLLEQSSGNGAMALLTRAAALLFVSAFHEHPQCGSAFLELPLHDPVWRAERYIQMHPFQRWTVDTLAEQVAMGRSNFATRFARETGKTPMEYLAQERMKHAAVYLETTDMKVAEVGQRVGYHSEASFIRRFVTCFGVTPGELRKRSRGTNGGSFGARGCESPLARCNRRPAGPL
jgi:AraC family transcriptional activator of mtrCDE